MFVDFKKEEEVQEYLDNLGIEYRFGCFSEKDPEACQLLGDYLETVKKDYAKASKIYKANCDENNYPRSCHKFGNYTMVGKGQNKRDFGVAYNYFSKACSLGVANSCLHAGLMDVKGVPQSKKERNFEKGVSTLDKACELGNDYACNFLSAMYIAGVNDPVVTKDMKTAFKYAEKGCELGNMQSCSNLILMYKRGEGVEKNEEMSEKMRKKVEEMNEEMSSGFHLEFGREKDSA